MALRQWTRRGWQPPAGSVLINPDDHAWYSGMMPGLLAGRFSREECAIPLEPLCEAAGLELILNRVDALDTEDRSLQLWQSTRNYELLSVNTGSTPASPTESDGSIPLVPAKPFRGFISAWEQWQQARSTPHLAILGGGPAAFELALSLQQSLPRLRMTLVSDRPLLAGHPKKLASKARRFLHRKDITVIENRRIDRIADGRLYAKEDFVLKADALILATGATAQPWYREASLEHDPSGFIRVDSTLQASGRADIFAAGDCISLPGIQRSGVYSVRQGSTLARNIPATLSGKALRKYQPQAQSLALLATADGGALMSYRGRAAQGRLCGLWKDWLDRRFMRRHRLR